MTIKKFPIFALTLVSLIFFSSCDPKTKDSGENKKDYETVENDPTNTRIYTLDNGLKVYLSVNDEAPRVQTAIAVRAGSKNDPETATGLAHYLEHMLFKGTDQYGTLDFTKEEPLLKQIDSLYDVYGNTTDELERKSLYAQIDSISQLASTYAIANEYDKMVSEMGAKGTNAYTSQERTVYVNDIPSNQIEKWLELESERFRNPQFRLFHTELEAVYEEKNRTLDNDNRKAFYSLMEILYPNHQYGQQTTIGTIEHLKNPSLNEIKKYFNTYYVPNNMAICMAGDFDPDQLIEMIKKYFGGMEKKETPNFTVIDENPIKEIVATDIYGPDAELLYMAYRFEGIGSENAELMQLCDMILANSTAGIIDLNLNQQQKVLNASSFPYTLTDYSAHFLTGQPKEGQSLEEVKELLISQIDSLKAGAFPDWLPEACINDLKLNRMRSIDYNRGRTGLMIDAFITRTPWEIEVLRLEKLKEYTKEDIVAFANANYNDNYVVVYKKTGEDTTSKGVVKPSITPVKVNRDDASQFLTQLSKKKVNAIEPRFLSYDKDIYQSQLTNGILVRYVENTSNDLFTMYYVFDMGKLNNQKIGLALDYLQYLGTSKYTPSQVQQEFYKIGCDFNVSASDKRVYVYLNGLTENFNAGIELFEHLLKDAQPQQAPLDNMVSDILKSRSDAKLSKEEIFSNGLNNYGRYGAKSPFTYVLSESQLRQIKPTELTDIIHNLTSYEHRVLYYGPLSPENLIADLDQYHKVPSELKQIPPAKKFPELSNNSTNVYVVDYEMKQAEILLLSKKELYNSKTAAAAAVYNEYFGGGMGSIVFQEMRESKALAYSVYSAFTSPSYSTDAHYVMAYIGTQADKLKEAMEGMTELLESMPESKNTLDLAKKAALEKIRTERITKTAKLWAYETALTRGVDHDLRQDIYREVPNMTMADLRKFHAEYVKNGKYNIMVIGDLDNLNVDALKEYGPITRLNLTEIFGY